MSPTQNSLGVDQPNILLITTDQQRFDTVGEHAPEMLRTPHLDQLGREGATFDRAYAESPICVPSRVSIMTGKSVVNHGLIGNDPTSSVMGRENTLPSVLRDAGYQTAGIGKMHFTPERARHGFDELILPADYYRWMDRQGETALRPMRHGIGQNEMYPTMATVPEGLTLTSWIAEQCVEYITQRRDPTVPFFLWASFTKPHPPLDPPEPYYSMYDPDEVPGPVHGDWSKGGKVPPGFRYGQVRSGYDVIPESVYRAAKAAYFGLITQVDYVIGRIFGALQDEELSDDTMVMFTSDHGEYLGDHGAASKSYFHEVSARVPMILRLPKSTDSDIAGVTVDNVVTHSDILETFATAAGAAVPDGTDGQDLVALARGEIEDPRPYIVGTTGISYIARTGYPPFLGITDGHHKYLWYPEGSVAQFFDLKADPLELTDLSTDDDYSDVRANLRDLLVQDLQERAPHWLDDGELPEVEPIGEPDSYIRRQGWPGFQGEHGPTDTRH